MSSLAWRPSGTLQAPRAAEPCSGKSRGGDPGKNKSREGQGINIHLKHVSVNLDLNKLKPV